MRDTELPERIHERIRKAIGIIRDDRHLVAFTGAGISVESGVPPFRGPDGMWSSYDPKYLDLSYFHLYEHFAKAQPNDAHRILARLEALGLLKAVITQNIDSV
jgi:NAD-dependent deacetylase